MKLLDQSEVQARIDLLTLKAKYLSAEIEASSGSRPDSPSLTGSDVIADLETMERHCTALEARSRGQNASATSATTAQAAAKSTTRTHVTEHQKEVAAETILNRKAQAERLRGLNATEQVLIANGVTTLDELKEKKREERNKQYKR